MIRVANIIEEAKLGGPQIRIANVAHALKGHIETTVILPRQNSNRFRAKLDALDVSYKVLSLSRITKEFVPACCYLCFSLFEIVRLVHYLLKQRYDIIHISGGAAQYKGLIAGKLTGTKSVWHLNDTSMPWVIRRIFSLFSSLPDAYIYASKRTQKYYSPMINSGKRWYVIPAPVDTKIFSPQLKIRGDEALTNKWVGKTVIGTTANISPTKGLEDFIKAAATLNGQCKDLVFIVVGEIFGRQHTYYKKLLDLCNQLSVDNLFFVGGRDDVRSVIQRFDIYVCTSLAESSPISVWEAMSMGKPVVSADVGDVSKYVINGQNGFITDGHDEVSLANRVNTLISDEVMRKEFGRKSREIAISELDLAICARKHQYTYEDVTRCSN